VDTLADPCWCWPWEIREEAAQLLHQHCSCLVQLLAVCLPQLLQGKLRNATALEFASVAASLVAGLDADMAQAALQRLKGSTVAELRQQVLIATTLQAAGAHRVSADWFDTHQRQQLHIACLQIKNLFPAAPQAVVEERSVGHAAAALAEPAAVPAEAVAEAKAAAWAATAAAALRASARGAFLPSPAGVFILHQAEPQPAAASYAGGRLANNSPGSYIVIPGELQGAGRQASTWRALSGSGRASRHALSRRRLFAGTSSSGSSSGSGDVEEGAHDREDKVEHRGCGLLVFFFRNRIVREAIKCIGMLTGSTGQRKSMSQKSQRH